SAGCQQAKNRDKGDHCCRTTPPTIAGGRGRRIQIETTGLCPRSGNGPRFSRKAKKKGAEAPFFKPRSGNDLALKLATAHPPQAKESRTQQQKAARFGDRVAHAALCT